MIIKSRNSSFGITTGYRLDSHGLNPDRGKIFLFSVMSRLTLEPTQPPVQWAVRAFSLVVKQKSHEADHQCPSGAKVKNGGAIPPLPHMIVLN
jgi:hypothetical protein